MPRLLAILTMLATLALGSTNSVTALPPLPVSAATNEATSAVSNVATNDGWREAYRYEFAPICHKCGCTNRYALVFSTKDMPMFNLDIPMETSTDLVNWTTTNLTQKLIASDDQRFYRMPRKGAAINATATVEGK
jgi:hypothetical protein